MTAHLSDHDRENFAHARDLIHYCEQLAHDHCDTTVTEQLTGDALELIVEVEHEHALDNAIAASAFSVAEASLQIVSRQLHDAKYAQAESAYQSADQYMRLAQRYLDAA